MGTVIAALLWTRRTLSERASLLLFAAGALWLAFLAAQGSDPIDTGNEFAAYLGALLFMILFGLCAVPVAAAMLFWGGADFVSPWRRAADRLLPCLVLALLWLGLLAL